MKKIVFFDVDGTLLDTKFEIPASTIAAIRTLKEKGIMVAIATGRAPFNILPVQQALHINSCVCLNGQYAVSGGEVVHKSIIPKAVISDFMQYSQEIDQAFVYVNEKEYVATLTDCHPVASYCFDLLGLPYPKRDDHYYQSNDVIQINTFSSNEFDDGFQKNFPMLGFVRHDRFFSDVVLKGQSKSLGIRKFIEKENIPMENVYAFGDGMNDLEMIRDVGFSVAMGNAVDEIKNEADFVTKHVDEDGIYYGLKELGLI